MIEGWKPEVALPFPGSVNSCLKAHQLTRKALHNKYDAFLYWLVKENMNNYICKNEPDGIKIAHK